MGRVVALLRLAAADVPTLGTQTQASRAATLFALKGARLGNPVRGVGAFGLGAGRGHRSRVPPDRSSIVRREVVRRVLVQVDDRLARLLPGPPAAGSGHHVQHASPLTAPLNVLSCSTIRLIS